MRLSSTVALANTASTGTRTSASGRESAAKAQSRPLETGRAREAAPAAAEIIRPARGTSMPLNVHPLQVGSTAITAPASTPARSPPNSSASADDIAADAAAKTAPRTARSVSGLAPTRMAAARSAVQSGEVVLSTRSPGLKTGPYPAAQLAAARSVMYASSNGWKWRRLPHQREIATQAPAEKRGTMSLQRGRRTIVLLYPHQARDDGRSIVASSAGLSAPLIVLHWRALVARAASGMDILHASGRSRSLPCAGRAWPGTIFSSLQPPGTRS